MSKGVVIRKDANVVIPKEILEKALETYPTLWGVGVIDKGNKVLASDYGVGNGSVDAWVELMEKAKDLTIYFHLQEAQGSPDTEDCQPFTLLSDKDGNPLIMAFVEGMFDEYKEDTERTCEYNFYHTYLTPKVLQLHGSYSTHENPMAQLESHFQSNVFKKEMGAMFGDRASVTIITNTGFDITLQKGNDGVAKEHEWGWISDMFGIEESPPPDKKEGPPAKQSLMDKLGLGKSKGSPPASSTAATTPAAVASDYESSKDPMSHIVVKGSGMCYPTAYIASNKDRLKSWCNDTFGTCPTGYHLAVGSPEKFPGVHVSKILPNSKVAKANPGLVTVGTAAAASTGGQGKDTAPKEVKPAMALPVQSSFEVIPANMKEQASKLIKTLDFKSKDIMNPETMQLVEKEKKPDFYDQFPHITRDNAAGTDPAKLREICQKWPDVAKLWIETLLYDWLEERAKNKKVDTPAEGTQPQSALRARLGLK